MATNIKRKVRKIKTNGELPPETDLEFILHGSCMLDGDFPSDTPENLWKRWSKTIMQLQGQLCGDLVPWHGGRKYFFDLWERPCLWWQCGPGAEEPRRLVSGDPAKICTEKGYTRGLPNWFKTAEHGCIFESEREYICRRGLLTAAEKRLLGAENC